MIASHDTVVQCRERVDRVRFLGDQEQKERNEKNEERSQQRWDERLDHFLKELVAVEVRLLKYKSARTQG